MALILLYLYIHLYIIYIYIYREREFGVVSWFQCPKSNIEEKQGRIRAGRQTSTAAEKVQTWGRRGRRTRERGEWGDIRRNTKRNREKSALVGKQHSQREKRILERRRGGGATIWKTPSVMERPTTEGDRLMEGRWRSGGRMAGQDGGRFECLFGCQRDDKDTKGGFCLCNYVTCASNSVTGESW